MIRYYILPAVVKTAGQGQPQQTMGIEPKYLAALTAAQVAGNVHDLRGWLPAELAPDGLGFRQWLQSHYIMRIDANDFTQLDAQPDVIQLTRTYLVAHIPQLQALGINTTGLTLTTPLKAIERRLLLWLQGVDTDLATATGINETIPV